MIKQFKIKMEPKGIVREEFEAEESLAKRCQMLLTPQITSPDCNDRMMGEIHQGLSHLVGEPMDDIAAEKGIELLRPIFERRGWEVLSAFHEYFYDDKAVVFTITGERLFNGEGYDVS